MKEYRKKINSCVFRKYLLNKKSSVDTENCILSSQIFHLNIYVN